MNEPKIGMKPQKPKLTYQPGGFWRCVGNDIQAAGVKPTDALRLWQKLDSVRQMVIWRK